MIWIQLSSTHFKSSSQIIQLTDFRNISERFSRSDYFVLPTAIMTSTNTLILSRCVTTLKAYWFLLNVVFTRYHDRQCDIITRRSQQCGGSKRLRLLSPLVQTEFPGFQRRVLLYRVVSQVRLVQFSSCSSNCLYYCLSRRSQYLHILDSSSSFWKTASVKFTTSAQEMEIIYRSKHWRLIAW